MKAYKNIVLFALVWFALFFSIEFGMDKLFDDETPFWKLLAISLISAVVVVYPFIKRGKDFSFAQVKKKQKRKVLFKQEIDSTELLQKIVATLKSSGYRIKKVDAAEISFRSKRSFQTFGENYKIRFLETEIEIESYPAFYMVPLDGGHVFDEINAIEKAIQQKLITP